MPKRFKPSFIGGRRGDPLLEASRKERQRRKKLKRRAPVVTEENLRGETERLRRRRKRGRAPTVTNRDLPSYSQEMRGEREPVRQPRAPVVTDVSRRTAGEHLAELLRGPVQRLPMPEPGTYRDVEELPAPELESTPEPPQFATPVFDIEVRPEPPGSAETVDVIEQMPVPHRVAQAEALKMLSADPLIAELEPDLVDAVERGRRQLQQRHPGFDIAVNSGLRTVDEQRRLHERGLTHLSGEPGQESQHQHGRAVDLGVVGPEGKDFELRETLGRILEELGLEWGGNYRNREPWHFALPRE
jgi:hypothetical protein